MHFSDLGVIIFWCLIALVNCSKRLCHCLFVKQLEVNLEADTQCLECTLHWLLSVWHLEILENLALFLSRGFFVKKGIHEDRGQASSQTGGSLSSAWDFMIRVGLQMCTALQCISSLACCLLQILKYLVTLPSYKLIFQPYLEYLEVLITCPRVVDSVGM